MDGSSSKIVVEKEKKSEDSTPPNIFPLALQPKPRVKWSSEVINNEGKGKKSSKSMIIKALYLKNFHVN